jgi:hypothetical protein
MPAGRGRVRLRRVRRGQGKGGARGRAAPAHARFESKTSFASSVTDSLNTPPPSTPASSLSDWLTNVIATGAVRSTPASLSNPSSPTCSRQIVARCRRGAKPARAARPTASNGLSSHTVYAGQNASKACRRGSHARAFLRDPAVEHRDAHVELDCERDVVQHAETQAERGRVAPALARVRWPCERGCAVRGRVDVRDEMLGLERRRAHERRSIDRGVDDPVALGCELGGPVSPASFPQ